MATIQSDAAKGLLTPPNAYLAGVETVMRYSMAVPTGVAANDILELACCPAGHRVTEIIQDTDDLDSDGSPAIAYDIGFMSGKWQDTGARTCGAEFYSGSTLARAGGVDRPTLKTAYRDAGAAYPRSIGVKITTVAATAAAGSIALTVRTVPIG